MTLPPYAKAIVAAVAGAVVPAVPALASGSATSTTGLESAIGLLVSGLLTYFVPNGAGKPVAPVVALAPAAPSTGGGLVVTVRTDGEKFLSTFNAGLPGLVQSSMAAALDTTKDAPTP